MRKKTLYFNRGGESYAFFNYLQNISARHSTRQAQGIIPGKAYASRICF